MRTWLSTTMDARLICRCVFISHHHELPFLNHLRIPISPRISQLTYVRTKIKNHTIPRCKPPKCEYTRPPFRFPERKNSIS